MLEAARKEWTTNVGTFEKNWEDRISKMEEIQKSDTTPKDHRVMPKASQVTMPFIQKTAEKIPETPEIHDTSPGMQTRVSTAETPLTKAILEEVIQKMFSGGKETASKKDLSPQHHHTN